MLRPFSAAAPRKKAVWGRSFVLALLATMVALPAAAQVSSTDNGKLDEAVREAVNTGRPARVIMRFETIAERDQAFNRLLDRGAAVRKLDLEDPSLDVVSTSAFTTELATAQQVSLDAKVKVNAVTPARPVNVRSSGASLVQQIYNRRGTGISVAVIDSGVMVGADLPASRIRKYRDFVTGGTTPVDNCGHGTHVAGTIAGNGFASFGDYTGIAPDVDIVALRVLGDDCSGNTSDVIDALEWVGRNAALYNIRVVNLSLGHPVFEKAAKDPMVKAVERLSRKGILVVTSAGNMGVNPETGFPGYGGVGVPCNAPSSVCVGALDTHGTAEFGDDTVAPFSARGPTRFDLLVKPDLVANGVKVVSVSAPGSKLFNGLPNNQIFGGNEGANKPAGYLMLTGTSMSSPVVAGAAALILDANKGLSANSVKMLMQFTARVLPGVDSLTQGAGALNVLGAVRLAQMVNPTAKKGAYWLRSRTVPSSNADPFGQPVKWGKRIIWGDRFIKGDAAYVHLLRWDDNIVWGLDTLANNFVFANSDDDNVVWGNYYDENDQIVWGNAAIEEQIVWGDNVVWGQNVVWGYWADNIVWGFWDDQIVWGNVTHAAMDQIVWGNDWDNIVWGNCSAGNSDDDNIVWGNSDDDQIVWGNSAHCGGGH